MNCPNCTTELRIADRLGVEIDYCPRCRGVWLDRGELDKILEREATGHTTDEYPGRGKHSHQNGHDYAPKKKESFWAKMLDFD